MGSGEHTTEGSHGRGRNNGRKLSGAAGENDGKNSSFIQGFENERLFHYACAWHNWDLPATDYREILQSLHAASPRRAQVDVWRACDLLAEKPHIV